jgi:hypothetical protein
MSSRFHLGSSTRRLPQPRHEKIVDRAKRYPPILLSDEHVMPSYTFIRGARVTHGAARFAMTRRGLHAVGATVN